MINHHKTIQNWNSQNRIFFRQGVQVAIIYEYCFPATSSKSELTVIINVLTAIFSSGKTLQQQHELSRVAMERQVQLLQERRPVLGLLHSGKFDYFANKANPAWPSS